MPSILTLATVPDEARPLVPGLPGRAIDAPPLRPGLAATRDFT